MAGFYRVDPIATPKGTVIRIKSFEVVDGGDAGNKAGNARPCLLDSRLWAVEWPDRCGFPSE